MKKKELREKYKTLRKALSQSEIDKLSLDIANKILELHIWNKSFYHIFLAIEKQKEVNTDFLLNVLSGKDKNIVVSKSNFETGKMINYLLTDNTKIIKNKYDIPEPVDGIEIAYDKIDVVFIPLLAFDKQGQRVGYGKGFYDRFLASCKLNTIKVGLSFFEAEDKISDTFKADVTLDFCVTPTSIYKF